MPLTANEVRYMTTAETRNCIASFANRLEDGEVLTGTPTITSTTGITLSNKHINTGVVVVEGVDVAIGGAVQWKVEATTAGTYLITITCDTDSNPVQTLQGFCVLIVTE
jgi:hypothetical protein